MIQTQKILKMVAEGIEDLHVTSSMTLRTVAAILEVYFCAARDVLMDSEITLENGRK
jgi:hypothetical protein